MGKQKALGENKLQESNIYVEGLINDEEILLDVQNLTKRYPTFTLDNVSFCIPTGVIVGFIGQNGAGKSTTLKCVMRTTLPDGGVVKIFGKNMSQNERECKQHIAFSTGTFEYYRGERLKKIAKVYKNFYQNWNERAFADYCQRFALDLSKKVNELSAGMKVKFALALALSHEAQLFVFDEPTSGLDPIAREELLDVFRDIVLDGDKSILFSTHITSDLDKCADYILFIANGKILLYQGKDQLLESHALFKGGLESLTQDLEGRAIAVKKNAFGFVGLICREKLLPTDNVVTEKPTLDDVMVYFSLGEKQDA